MRFAADKEIPYAWKKLDRKMELANPNGSFATELKDPLTDENIPSIGDIQLFWEFMNFRYFDKEYSGYTEDWERRFPRLAIWYELDQV